MNIYVVLKCYMCNKYNPFYFKETFNNKHELKSNTNRDKANAVNTLNT